MSIVKFNIDDILVKTVGLKAIEKFIEQQLSYLRLQYLGEKISSIIKEEGFDHSKEVEEARQEAWLEYKSKYLPV